MEAAALLGLVIINQLIQAAAAGDHLASVVQKPTPAAAVATAAMLRLRLQVQGIPPQALEHLLAGKVVTWVPLVQLLRSLEGERISPRMRVGLVALLLMVMPQRG